MDPADVEEPPVPQDPPPLEDPPPPVPVDLAAQPPAGPVPRSTPRLPDVKLSYDGSKVWKEKKKTFYHLSYMSRGHTAPMVA
jgi:hypothetical protein